MPNQARSQANRLSRSWILWLGANGALVAAEKGDTRPKDQGALPIGSVGTEEDAEKFQAMFCKLAYDNETYLLPWPTTDDEDERYQALVAAGNLVADWWQLNVDGVTGPACWEPFLKYRRTIKDPMLALMEDGANA